tara:strand:+ start:933 stop:3212 length:2280 start_codon:yes stop_codon:yes gene_type:complete
MAGLKGLENIFTEFRTEVDNQTTTGASYIDDIHAKGFKVNTNSTDFLGIEGSTYTNPSEFGYDGHIVNAIEDLHGFGFVPGLQAGDDTLFVGQLGPNYNNPGPNLGIYYTDDYENGPTPDFIQFTKNRQAGDLSEFLGVDDDSDTYQNPIDDLQIQLTSDWWQDSFGHQFTPNRKHLDTSEFLGLDEDGNTYVNPGINLGIHYYDTYNDPGIGVDVIRNIDAVGFKKLKKHKDTSDFTMVGETNSIEPIKDTTLFRRFGDKPFDFGMEQKKKYLPKGGKLPKKGDIDPDVVSLIQQGGIRSVGSTGVLQSSEVSGITLEDIWNSHIDDLIDWENVKGKTDGRLDMRYDNGMFSANSFLPFAFSRNGITHEPYVIRGIGDSKNIVSQHLNDLERVGKYFLSPDGIKFIAAQNAMGLLAYFHRRSVTHGKDDQYGFFGSAAGLQQFQYTYNPLSAFSTTVPFVKFRFNRSLLFDEQKYTDKEPAKLFGITIPDITPNKNVKVDGIDNQSPELTTLGGSILKNANTSIDGTTVNEQDITGDVYTLSPIATEEEILTETRSTNKDKLDSIEDGYPFYFKDMRNDKILMFRGYVKDISENIAPSYQSEQYIGRSEPVYSYTSTQRTLNLSLDLFGNNRDEFRKIYQKLDYLTGMCYPEYFNDSSNSGYTLTRPKPPLVRMRLAELFGGGSKAQADNPQMKYGVLGYLNALNYTYNEEGVWHNFDEESRAPMFITATIGFTVIHDETPNINTRFYGVDYGKVGVE